MLLNRVDLAELLRAAADGVFPPVDGGVARSAPWRDGVEAAVALTGHAVLAVADDVPDRRLVDLGAHGFGGAHDPRLTATLAGDGDIGVLDVLLAGRGRGGAADLLVERPDLAGTERVRHAVLWRDDVRCLGLPDRSRTGVATLSRGIAGLTEVGIQADDGSAPRLLRGALAEVAVDEVVLASVTPGNSRSLRFFLRHGFVPLGSVQQWRPARHGSVP